MEVDVQDEPNPADTQPMAAPRPAITRAPQGGACWFVNGGRLDAWPWLVDENSYVYKRKGDKWFCIYFIFHFIC
jgi:hypothetical protein